jgi:hypothetical protein
MPGVLLVMARLQRIRYRALLAMAVGEVGGGGGVPWLSCEKTQPGAVLLKALNARSLFLDHGAYGSSAIP